MYDLNLLKEPETLFTLTSLRKRLGLKLDEVAEEINISVPTLVAWEKDSGGLSLEKVRQLAKLYSVEG